MHLSVGDGESALPESTGPTGKRSARKRACSVWSGGKAAKPYLSLPHRITSHIKLCVLALLLERAAEIRVGDTWRNLRFALEEVKAVRYRVHGLTLVQSTRLTTQVTAYLKKLGVKPPPRVLSIESSSATP